ncbi:GrpE -like protein 1 [Sarcoptes scabiei]|uniref:GrpE protein homolog n=1 Tax=Sarcoptes scabiei TaxID=52283 RepID=A0A834VCS4_SARSC|nr:GrpE -like protein 1 [Sarcoptes scabiei]UXI20115.1 WD repeat-containing protein 54 [Sarcoptes scabiei]
MISNSLKILIRSNLYRSMSRTERNFRCFSSVNFSDAKNNENLSTDSSASEDQKSPNETIDKSQDRIDLERLKDENTSLLDSLKDLDDKYKRALAEAENTRLRSKKQLDDAKIYAIQGFCKDLLEVADIFKSAIDSVPKDSISADNNLKNLYDGVVMTEQKLMNVFSRHGLCQINPIGAKFNPNEHHALFQVDDPDKEPGTVSSVTKIGFKLHDRTIRPAMVGVVKS